MSLEPLMFRVLRDYLESPCGGLVKGDVIVWDEARCRARPATMYRLIHLADVRDRMVAAMAAEIILPLGVDRAEAAARLSRYVFRPTPPGGQHEPHPGRLEAHLRLVRHSGDHARPPGLG